jgi:HEAT repeat protein
MSKNVFNIWWAFLSDKKRPAGSIRELVTNGFGLFIEENVTIRLLSAEKHNLTILSFHNDGNKGFLTNHKGDVTVLSKSEAVSMAEADREAKWSAMKKFVHDLKDRDSKVRIEGVKAFVFTNDERAIQPLIEALNDKDAIVRRNAARGLAVFNFQKAVDPLIDAMRNDEDTEVRRNATLALGVIRDSRVIEPLIETLKVGDTLIKKAAEQSLLNQGSLLKEKKSVDSLIKLLKCENKALRGFSASMLGRIPDNKSIFPLIEALNDPDGEVRFFAAYALSKHIINDARAVEPLISALRDDEWRVRNQAAMALGGIKDSRAVTPLIGALRDDEWKVRKHAAMALGGIKDSRAVTPLIGLLQDDNSAVRSMAAYSLGLLGDERAVEPLIKTLKDSGFLIRTRTLEKSKWGREESQLRLSIIKTLGKLKDERAIPSLREALNKGDRVVSSSAVSAICEIAVAHNYMKNNPAVKALNDALNHKDKFIRKMAKNCLKMYQ